MSSLSFIGMIKILFLLHSKNTNRYLFPLFEVTGNLAVKYVSIFLVWSIILVNNLLVHCAIGFISGSLSFIGACCLVDFMLFLVWCMWPLDVAIDGGRCSLIMLIVKLGYVEN